MPLPQIDKPQIVTKPCPNFWQGRSGLKPIAIVDHIAEGSKESVAAWFANPDSKASAHFLVTQDGEIWQFVDTANSAWGNGIFESPDMSVGWLATAYNLGQNPNKLTISIEHEGYHGQPLTPKQYQASLQLHKWLCSTFNITPNRQYIIGHYQIQKYERANCPGSSFPFDALISDLQAWQNAGDEVILNGFTMRGEILAHWQKYGGVITFGLPLTNEYVASDTYLTTQVFERAVLEFWPQNKTPYRVQGKLLGKAWLDARGGKV